MGNTMEDGKTDFSRVNCDTMKGAITKWNAIFPDEKINNYRKMKKPELIAVCERIKWERYNTEKKVYNLLIIGELARQFLFDNNERDIVKYMKDPRHASGYYELISEIDGVKTGRVFVWEAYNKPVWDKLFVWNTGDEFDDIITGTHPQFYLLGRGKDRDIIYF
jgi:hypothetical protein